MTQADRSAVGLRFAQLSRYRLFFPLAAGLGYYLSARLGVAASAMSEGISIFWLPNGILLAALLMAPRRDWPLYMLAAVLAEIAADLPTFTLAQALGFAAVNLFECTLAAMLLERFARPFLLDRLRHVVLFGVFALVVAGGLAALLGALIYSQTVATTTSFWTFWMIWWLGDGLGVLLVTPLLLSWQQGSGESTEPRYLEAMTLFALTLLLTIWVFTYALDSADVVLRPFLLLPLSLWAAVRFGVRGAASIGLLIAAIAIAASLHGMGPLVMATPARTSLLLQEFLAVQALSSLALATLLQEVRTTHGALNRLNRELEARVETRTLELQQAVRHLEALASTDQLTGASNRRHFLDVARTEISRARRQGSPLSVVMLDIDFFKSINDRFGHEAGDKVLATLAATVRDTLRAGDIFARLGGEEFILMLPGQGLDDAFRMAERLRLLVAEMETPGCPARITLSAGVAGLQHETDDVGTLLRGADQALYQAKHQGRNRTCVESAASPQGAADA